MKKDKNILFIFCFLLPTISVAQMQRLNWNVIIDGEMADLRYGILSDNSAFILEDHNLQRDTININIYPGGISLYPSDYDSITQNFHNLKNIYLYFEYFILYDDNAKWRYYEIPLGTTPMMMFRDKDYFMVIYVYNTDKKENKKYYIPLSGKTYNYEIFCNERTNIPIRDKIQKRLTKRQKKYRISVF
jgi:hypothetical protein